MAEEQHLLQLMANFGFPAVLVGALWIAYNRLVQQLIEVVRNNTETMVRLVERFDRMEREQSRDRRCPRVPKPTEKDDQET